MADYILIKPANSQQWVRARETNLPNEDVLQQLMKEHPETLPLEDVSGEAQPLLVVGRESQLGNGYADVIGIDPSGLVTVIECKLDRNPDAKRTVLGQVLGYGAYLWRLTYEAFEEQIVRPYFTSPNCPRSELVEASLVDAMQRHVEAQSLGGGWSPQEFQQHVEENLRLGRIRLVIVVDKVNDELRRTVEFLNNCTGPEFQCVCAELRHYASETATLLVPTLIGVPAKGPPPTSGPKPRWTEEQFFAALERTAGSLAVAAARHFPTWCRRSFDWVSWGTGRTYPSFITGLHWQGVRVATLFAIYPQGTLEVGFAYFKAYPPYTNEAHRRALLDEINGISGVKLPADRVGLRPSFKVALLADDAAFARFQAAFERAAAELRRARDGLSDAGPASEGRLPSRTDDAG